jgi:hypothetical protein
MRDAEEMGRCPIPKEQVNACPGRWQIFQVKGPQPDELWKVAPGPLDQAPPPSGRETPKVQTQR